ncbi:MAG: putative toxin-antitoxin system toxin component, PIN family, partial [Chloroflexi bacterium]|nr:putative toxin-antitoxin system toxin component, PIN family [Chloroflexota bacterium]
MYRVVIDPGVLISALLSPHGHPASLYLRWRAGDFELIVSPALLDELQRVLNRPRFRAHVTPEEANRYVDVLRREAIVAQDPPDPPRVSRDQKDDYLIALARLGRAHYLVSGDRDLTDLADPGPPILTPREFVAVL